MKCESCILQNVRGDLIICVWKLVFLMLCLINTTRIHFSSYDLMKTLLQDLVKNLIHYCSHLTDLEGVLRKADDWDRDEPKGASATRPCSCSSDNVHVHVMMQVWFARILKPCSRFSTSLSSNLDHNYLFSPLLFTPLGILTFGE